jgi:hypothetical protein
MKRGKKLLSVGVSLALLSTQLMSAALAAGNNYQDTKGHWAQSAIDRWSGYGIVQGYNGSFEPEASITRAQMAAILSRTLGLSETKGNPFSDVASDAWYAEDVSKCYAAGILQGSDGKANPESQVTRAEAMTMLCRALNIAPESNPDLASYADAGEVESWAAPYVAALIDSGAVSGVGENRLAPTESMSRAALVTVLDRAIAQYIPESGTYTMTTTPGLIVVAAGDVTLTGKTSDSVLITAGADGETVSFVDAVITGAVTVQADNASVTTTNATLPTPTLLGANTTVGDAAPSTSNTNATATTTKTTSSGGSSSSSSSSDDDSSSSSRKKSTQTTEISEDITGVTYQDVTIAAALGDGDITLTDVTITRNLTIEGGGENSIHLNNCKIGGKVIMNKVPSEKYSQTPRLDLTETAINEIEVVRPAILEAQDTHSTIGSVIAENDVTIQGQNTTIKTLTVPQEATDVTVEVNAGNVTTLEAKAPTTITGDAENAIANLEASASVAVDAKVIAKLSVPDSVSEDVEIDLLGTDKTSVEMNVHTSSVTIKKQSDDIDTDNTTDGSQSVTTEVDPDIGNSSSDDKKNEGSASGGDNTEGAGGTSGNGEVLPAEQHTFDEGVTVDATCTADGSITYTCSDADCTLPNKQKVDTIPATGHQYGEWTTTDDKHSRTCSVCSNVDEGEHSWGDWTTDSDNHSHTCSVCQKVVSGEHTFNEGSDTCSVCGETKTETTPAGDET